MPNDLAAQDGDNALRRRLKHDAHVQLLIIDEIGYLSYSNRHADLLFEIINRRYEQGSTIVTTNRPFGEWNEVFPNAACVVSLIDRLVHHSEVIAIEGDSYRMKEAQEQAAERQRKNSRKVNVVTSSCCSSVSGPSSSVNQGNNEPWIFSQYCDEEVNTRPTLTIIKSAS